MLECKLDKMSYFEQKYYRQDTRQLNVVSVVSGA